MSTDPTSSGGLPPAPTMADVAHAIGMSRASVSMVLRGLPGPSEDTRQRVLAAAAELGYRANTSAQVLRRSRSRQIGVVFALRHSFEVELVERMYPTAAEAGYELVLAPMTQERDQHTAVEELVGRRCESLILVGPDANPGELTGIAQRLPTVVVGRRVKKPAFDVIRTDDAGGTRLAVQHLVDLGHRHITHIDGGTMPGAAERRRGYVTAMRRAGLTEFTHVIPGSYSEDAGRNAVTALLAHDTLPTGLIAGNDRCAFGVLDTLTRNGISVPDEISLVGFDDSRLSRLPLFDLTSVHQDADALGALAVRAAIERIETDRSPTETALPATLSVRATTAAPRTVDERPLRSRNPA